MKNFGLIQFVLASSLAMLVTFPNQQINLPVETVEDNKRTFERFLEKFPMESLPYTTELEVINFNEDELIEPPQMDETLLLTDEFESILPALEHRKFSRMGPDDIYAEALLASTDDFHLLVYTRKHPFSFYSGSKVLAVFSRSGKLLDEMTISYSYGRDGGLATHIDQSFNLEIAEKESIWAKDVDQFGYKDNEIVGYKTISAEFWTINKDGEFEERDIEKMEETESVVVESNAD
ncbi:MAG: hypothetical protein AAF502_00950 [Bacteroidota bacterium]